ncbi:MAG: ATP-dependent metallopeptidase FtsH/Yme1/Tma family protein [Acidimicrobiales bacterium]
MGSIDILSRPEVILSAVVIVGGTLLALRLTNPLRHRDRSPGRPEERGGSVAQVYGARSHPSDSRRKGRRSPVPARGSGPPPRVTSDHPSVTFADVAGLDNAVAELREVADYLMDPGRYQALGADLPRGILLHGLPGCGKTLLARALAGETGVPFYFVSAASFVEKFVGLGAARVRELFEEAKHTTPSIVFIDELDAIGRHRNATASGDREFDHTLNQLLVELDGFEGVSGVLILGATNRPELIDPALLRPGRFDRQIQIDRPDREGREQILRLYASRRPFSSRVDWAEVSASTAGLNAAELANIINEAALLAARRHRSRVAPEDAEEAVSRMLAGTRSSRLMMEEERRLVAVHEAGHGLLSLLLRGVKPPARISIVGRSGSFARSAWSSDDDRAVLTKRELIAQLIVLLGGRAAELNAFGEPSSRAEDDLAHAAALTRRMVERWAMTGRFELAGGKEDAVSHRFEGSAGGQEVREFVRRAEQSARAILRDNAEHLRMIADALVQRETLTAVQMAEMTGLWAWRGGSPDQATTRHAEAT